MKLKWDETSKTRWIMAFLLVCASVIFYFLVKNFGYFVDAFANFLGILSPFIIGFAIAYLLFRPMCFFERILDKLFRNKRRGGIKRVISILTTFLVAILLFSTIIWFLIPQLYESVMTLIDSLPGYIRSLDSLTRDLIEKLNIDSEILNPNLFSWENILSRLGDVLATVVPWLFNVSLDLGSRITNVFMGIFISIYLLSGKEKYVAQLKKLLYAIFPKRGVDTTLEIARFTNRTFSKYISGQLFDAMIMGIMCFTSMTILRLPYALLVSVIVAVTNVIPMLGPFIGAIPGAFIILMAGRPIQMIYFVIMIVILQQIDGNILVPRIIGTSVGISGFWVLIAILVGGGLFGILGVILGVPAVSVLYSIVKALTERRLKKKGMPADTGAYRSDELPKIQKGEKVEPFGGEK